MQGGQLFLWLPFVSELENKISCIVKYYYITPITTVGVRENGDSSFQNNFDKISPKLYHVPRVHDKRTKTRLKQNVKN